MCDYKKYCPCLLQRVDDDIMYSFMVFCQLLKYISSSIYACNSVIICSRQIVFIHGIFALTSTEKNDYNDSN